MKKIINIPYYSQLQDVKDEYWKSRACGVLCLKSILDFFGIKTDKIDEFVKRANEKGAYGKNGWIHQGLIDIAKDFKIDLERKEFKSDFKNKSQILLKQGIEKIKFSLENDKPVLVSVAKRFKEEQKFHMVVLTGFEIDKNRELRGFYYNDTDYGNEQEGKNLFVNIKTFKKYWRRLALFMKK